MLDTPQFNSNFTNSALITPLNLVRVGPSYTNRVGRTIHLKSICLYGTIYFSGSDNTSDYGRILLVYDRQTNGALPAITDILGTHAQDGTTTTSNYSMQNLNNKDRFIILHDQRLFLPSTTTGVALDTDPVSVTFNIWMEPELRGLTTQYKSDSSPAVISDIATGSLLAVVYSGVASVTYTAILQARLKFKDTNAMLWEPLC